MKVFLAVVIYLAIGIAIAKFMGGDRSHLSSDVTYLDWIAAPLIVVLWPIVAILAAIAWLRGDL